jgi:PAS domain S-box-containing protein
VTGGDDSARQDAAALIRGAGFDQVETCADMGQRHHAEPPDETFDETPDVVIAIMAGADAAELCGSVRRQPRMSHVPLLVLAGDDDEAAVAAIEAGAEDILSPHAPVAVMRARLERVLAAAHERRQVEELEHLQEALHQVLAVSSRQGDSAHALRAILDIAAEVLEFERASLIAHIEGSASAYVIAATDDPTLFQFVISLDKYPEIAATLERKEPILLADIQSDALTAPVANLLADIDVRAVVLFPVVWKGMPVGVVALRKSTPGTSHMSEAHMMFGRAFASHAAACLEHGRVLASLRERTTDRMTRARFEAERRLRTIDTLKEHFEAAADGALVLDKTGNILFVNRAAEEITGFARSGLLGADVGVLVVDESTVRQVISRVLCGHNLDAFDLDLRTTSGENLCVSVTTSTVLGQSGAAVLSFRDVTAERALESELRQTKEFLEKLVDSTVDAIVAADMRGNVIIFNQGAERIYGYAATEVIGRIPVWQLYGKGVPKQVMRMLRSTQYGGVGRLEQTRREILNKRGELVPVNMTASIIYQDGREVATVGIFSDLRDRIRIEQRLLRAQEKLQMTEKQALVAELAGTAAHELNQPLTSIMGYAQLIQRQSDADAGHNRAVDIILRESERMAEIVKKIGRITNYETKEYVGSTLILDLDRSARAATAEIYAPGEPGDPGNPGNPGDPGPSERLDTVVDGGADLDSEELRDPDEFDSDATTQVQLLELLRHREQQAAERHQAGDSKASDNNADDGKPDTHDEQRVP